MGKERIHEMVPPSQRRPGKPEQGVIQIGVTRLCDKSCYGCTQGSNFKGNSGFITLDQFEQACQSLENYFGVVGVFGGNPCLHPQFPVLCDILSQYIPFHRRGLWANKLFGNGEACRRTFNPSVSNLNVHLDEEAYNEFRRDWPECRPFGLRQESRHSPPYVAIKDLIEDEEEQWNRIVNCDINKHWSAIIVVFRGELRGYFCEIAGAQAVLHQHEEDYPDLGVRIEKDGKDWWNQPMMSYFRQAEYHCLRCGVPLRGHGELAQTGTGPEQVTKTHANIAKPKQEKREVQIVTSLEQLGKPVSKMTDYLGNARG